MSPVFSIIVPVYNVARYLRDCLNSVFSQSYTNWECICVDDGSTDGSGDILDDYAMRDSRILVIHQENAGVSAARNVGLTASMGDYVCFLDPDDLFLTDWLLELYTAIHYNRCDLVWGKYISFKDGDHPIPVVRSDKKRCVYGEAARVEMLRHFLRDGRCFVYAVRRDILNDIRFANGVRLAEDVLFDIEIAGHINSLVRIDYAGYGYRMRSDSAITRRLESEERLEWLKRFKALSGYVKGVDCSLPIWQMIQFWIVNIGDAECAYQIRDELRRMCECGLLKVDQLPWPAKYTARFFIWMPSMVHIARFLLCGTYKIFFMFGGKV